MIYTILKTLVLITGPLLIAICVLCFIYFLNFPLVTIFVAAYLVFVTCFLVIIHEFIDLPFSSIFGLLILFGEFGWKRFLKHFPFLLIRRSSALFVALFVFLVFLFFFTVNLIINMLFFKIPLKYCLNFLIPYINLYFLLFMFHHCY